MWLLSRSKIYDIVAAYALTIYDIVYACFVVILAVYFLFRFITGRRIDRVNVSKTLALFAFVSWLMALYHFWSEHTVITLGFLATIGWLYTNHTNIRNQQRAHTMNALLQMRTNSVLNEHRINIFRKFPVGTKLTDADLLTIQQEARDTRSYNITSSARSTSTDDSRRYVANLYEFICVGMSEGDLDEEIIRKSLRGLMLNYYKQFGIFITYAKTRQPTAYEYFTHYFNRWGGPDLDNSVQAPVVQNEEANSREAAERSARN